MNPTDRHRALATLWLFTAGVEQNAVDTQGVSLAESLATVFGQMEREGRREAAYHYLTLQRSGEHDIDTGEYDVRELRRLIAAAEKGNDNEKRVQHVESPQRAVSFNRRG